MSVSVLEYAGLARDVYDQNGSVNLTGWTEKTDEAIAGMALNNSYFDTDPGVAVYQKGTEVVIAFDGWEDPSGEEIGAGILTLAGLDSAFYIKAYYFAKAAIDLFGQPDEPGGPTKNVSFVGHSQGGAFAGLMAAYFDKPAVTFNAQAANQALPETAMEQKVVLHDGIAYSWFGWGIHISLQEPNAEPLIPDEVITIPGGSTGSSQVTGFRMKNDIAGLGDQIGSVEEIDLGPNGNAGNDYHGIDLMRFVIAAGRVGDSDSAFVIQTLQEKSGNELANILNDHSLHESDANEPAKEFLREIVNKLVLGEGHFDAFVGDLTKIADYYAHEAVAGFGNALFEMAIEQASKTVTPDIAGVPIGTIYEATSNAFVVDVTDPSFQHFASIEEVKGWIPFANYHGSRWADVRTQEIAGEHWEYYDAYHRVLNEHAILVVSANDLGGIVDKSASQTAGLFFGAAGYDFFVSGSGDDFIDGAGGDDILNGGSGYNTLFGGAGNDVLLGNASAGQSDVLIGGSGNDTLTSQAGDDFLYGGEGIDVADYAAHSGGVAVTLDSTAGGPYAMVSSGTAGSDELFAIEKAIGTAARDTLKIVGPIYTGSIAEIDLGGGQASTVTDLIDLSNASEAMAVQIAANGQGSIQAKDGSGGTVTLTNADVEVIGSAYDDDITIDGFGATVSGGMGHDALQGGALDDVLSGGEGNDVIRGGGANDTLNGGSGLNSLYGEDGNDILTGGENTDTLEGGAGDDQLFGGIGHDSLDGGADNDTLTGENGNDSLYGGAGDDILNGGNQDDMLVGGEGADQLTGGDGSDQFHVGNLDVVHDAEVLDSVYFEGRLLAGAIRDITIKDGVKEYETIDLIGAHGEIYEINGDVQDQGGAGITVTIHLPGGAGTVVLNDFQQGDGGIGLYDHVTTHTKGSAGKFGNAGNLISPLVLDLDGDGIELTSLQSSNTYFDLDADGFAEKTGWVGGGDGLLALDRNGDGSINDITEVFGNATTDGFTELALLDSNTDGVIDAGDTQFADLRVWIDSNRDGTTDAGELKTLSELEIESISLSATEVTQTQLGNELSHISSYTRSDGSQQEIVDAWFANDQLDTRYLGDTSVSAEVAALANLKGHGELADLQVASENDAVLKGLVAEFDTLQSSDIAQILDKAEVILFHWAGTQDLAQDTRGPYMDSRQLITMEKIFGETFHHTLGTDTSDPRPNASKMLGAVWQEMLADTAAKLFLQSGLNGLSAGASYDLDSDLIVSTGSALDFQALADAAPNGLEDKLAYWKAVIPMVQIVASATGLQLSDYSDDLTNKLVETGVPLSLDDALIATAISGAGGDDVLVGTAGRDLMDGGQGNDVLEGGNGSDVYIFAKGGGQDLFDEQDDAVGYHGTDRLELLDVNSDEVTLERVEDDLILKIDGSSDQVTIKNQFFENNLGPDTIYRVDHQIENIVFADGVIWSEQGIREELLRGTDGNDTLTGFFAADRLDGGLGNDLLLGGDDADTYVFGLGYGQDQIYDEMKSIYFTDPDIVSFGPGISQDNITLIRTGQDGDDLVIEIDGTTDRLTITDQFFAGNLSQDGLFAINNRIEEFHFVDGTSLTDPQVREILLESTDGDDTLTGFFGVDTLDGGLGNDLMLGGNDADSYVFDIGYGTDRIDDYQTSIFFNDPDKVIFGAGVNTADVILSRLGDDLIFEFNGAGDSLTIEKQFVTNNLGSLRLNEVELFSFSDGTTWTAAQVKDMLLQSTDGDDTIVGFFGADTLDGGLGNDRLEGGNGGDTYIFNAGYGLDVIEDTQTSIFDNTPDVVLFGAGLLASDIVLNRVGANGRDLEVTFTGSTDSLLIQNMLFTSFYEIEEFHFAGGEVWTLADIWGSLLGATGGNDVIVGTGNADVLSGLAGDDTLTGKNGNDTLIGGQGNDRLIGSDGSDTYIFSRGDGMDVIDDNGFADTDRLIIHGYLPSEVTLGRYAPGSNHLVLTFAGTSDQITVINALDNGVGDNIEQYIFDDGTIWVPDDLRATLINESQTTGDDLIYGFDAGGDQLEGGLGNDELHGGDGSDDYIFTRGDGVDLIEDDGYLSTDRLVIHGYTPDEVTIGRSSPTSKHVVLTFDGTGDQITVRNTLDGSTLDTIEQIVFDDSTIWTPADLRAALLTGGDGDDLLYGFKTVDTLDGGLGNDRMEGGFGGDTYIFDSGYGADVIKDAGYNNDFDKVVFGTGISSGDLSLSYSSINASHLVVEVISTGDSLIIERMFDNSGYHIEAFEFSDGASWDRAEIIAAIAPPPAAAAQASSDPFSGFRTLRDLFDETETSGEAASDTSLFLADLIDEPGLQDTESLESQILTLLDPYGGDVPVSPGGAAGDADLASLTIFDAALVMPELPAEDYSATQ